MRRLRAGGLLLCGALLAACGPRAGAAPAAPTDPGAAVPAVSRHDQIAALDGQTVTVHGTYTQVEVRQRSPRDTRPPEYRGHVALVLDDGRKVYLEPVWSEAALRPQAERDRLDGRPVAATGVLHATMPEPDVPVATLTAPCLSDLSGISAR